MTTRITTADLMTAIMALTAAISAQLPKAEANVVPFSPKAAKANLSANKPSTFDRRLANATQYAASSGRIMGIWSVTNKDGKVSILNLGYDKKKVPANGREVLLATVDPSGKVSKVA